LETPLIHSRSKIFAAAFTAVCPAPPPQYNANQIEQQVCVPGGSQQHQYQQQQPTYSTRC
jgi:hypothetical protein